MESLILVRLSSFAGGRESSMSMTFNAGGAPSSSRSLSKEGLVDVLYTFRCVRSGRGSIYHGAALEACEEFLSLALP